MFAFLVLFTIHFSIAFFTRKTAFPSVIEGFWWVYQLVISPSHPNHSNSYILRIVWQSGHLFSKKSFLSPDVKVSCVQPEDQNWQSFLCSLLSHDSILVYGWFPLCLLDYFPPNYISFLNEQGRICFFMWIRMISPLFNKFSPPLNQYSGSMEFNYPQGNLIFCRAKY